MTQSDDAKVTKLLNLLSEIDGLVARKKMDLKMYNSDIKALHEQAQALRLEIEQSSLTTVLPIEERKPFKIEEVQIG